MEPIWRRSWRRRWRPSGAQRPPPTSGIEVEGDTVVACWREGVLLAVANLVRNSIRHGRPASGTPRMRGHRLGDPGDSRRQRSGHPAR
ncbi:MAG: hypothetical protein R2695_06260 [Acidimicrobiales bacterium]